MAKNFFGNFPEISYKLDDGKIVFIKDFFRKSKIEQEAVNSIIEYDLYELEDGERPDILATKLYNDARLHWLFFLVNDIENYFDWHKDNETFERYIEKKYKGKIFKFSNTTDIVSAPTDVLDHKFLLGEKVTQGDTFGRIIKVSPIEKTICVEGGDFVANQEITGAVSNKKSTPTSIINHRDGTAYFKNSDGIRTNIQTTGFSGVTFYEDEFDVNEEKRKIKIIQPSIVTSIVNKFEEVMSA